MRPSQEEVFNKLFNRLSDEGRGDLLFGASNVDTYKNAILSCTLGDALPEYFFEFPLIGTPWLDILVLYGRRELSAQGRFDGDDPYGYNAIFKRFVDEGARFETPDGKELGMGTELV